MPWINIGFVNWLMSKHIYFCSTASNENPVGNYLYEFLRKLRLSFIPNTMFYDTVCSLYDNDQALFVIIVCTLGGQHQMMTSPNNVDALSTGIWTANSFAVVRKVLVIRWYFIISENNWKWHWITNPRITLINILMIGFVAMPH